MQKAYINFASITFAFKADKILRLNNINAQIVKTPAQFSSCGCGNSIVIDETQLSHAESVLNKNNIPIKDIRMLKV